MTEKRHIPTSGKHNSQGEQITRGSAPACTSFILLGQKLTMTREEGEPFKRLIFSYLEAYPLSCPVSLHSPETQILTVPCWPGASYAWSSPHCVSSVLLLFTSPPPAALVPFLWLGLLALFPPVSSYGFPLYPTRSLQGPLSPLPPHPPGRGQLEELLVLTVSVQLQLAGTGPLGLLTSGHRSHPRPVDIVNPVKIQLTHPGASAVPPAGTCLGPV